MSYEKIYLKTKKYAEENCETERYEESKAAILACREDMEKLVCEKDGLSAEEMSKARKDILDRRGCAACAFVLSATIRGNEGFVSYPRHIKQWACDTPISDDFDLNASAHIDCGSSDFVTSFVEDVRKRRKEERRERYDGKGGK